MKKSTLAFAALGLGMLVLGAGRMVNAMSPNAHRTPVLVELFTSEGCSSCPPADKLLQHLVRKQPVDGVQIIALEEHVDYWNHLGWRDPFSTEQITARQNDYANAFNDNSVYTPEMVVNGRWGFVGSDSGSAYARIADAARHMLVEPSLSQSGKNIHVSLTLPANAAKSRVFLAITQDGLSTNVTEGENADETLTHISTVRELVGLGTASSGGTVSLSSTYHTTGSALHAVAFVQEERSQRIIGASEIDLQ